MTSPKFQQRDTPTSFSFALIVLTSIVTTLIVIFLTLIAINISSNRFLISPNNCVSVGDKFSCYIDSDWNSANLLTAITSFYSNFIVLLVTIITLIGAIAVISIRHSAKQHVETELPAITANYFSTENGQKLLVKSTEELRDKISNSEKTEIKLTEMVYSLIDRVTKIETSAEETDTGVTIQPPIALEGDEPQGDAGDDTEEEH